MISTYDLFEAIIDDYILPFKIKQYEFKGIYNENNNDNSSEKVKYNKHDFDHNKAIIKKILQDEMKETPYCKFVAWCSSIGNLMKWKEFIKNEVPELTVYIAHSGNASNPSINEYEQFYKLKPKNKNDKEKINAILLNVSIVSEGCDIDFVDSGIFLDPVKDKNIVTYLQNAGRICRTDIYGRKTHANIIYTYLSEKKDISIQIISYFEMLLQLTEKNDNYFNKMNELVKNLKVDNKEIRIIIDKREEHDCVMYLDKEVKDWNKIKKEIENVVREKYGKQDDELNKLKKLSYSHSTILFCYLKDKYVKKNNYNPILIELYELINDSNNILKFQSIGLVKGKKNGRTCNYLEDLDITVTDVNAGMAIFELYTQCKNNDIKLNICIRLDDDKLLIINIEKGESKIKVYNIVKIKNVEYLTNKENVYKFENNTKGELYGNINRETGKIKIV